MPAGGTMPACRRCCSLGIGRVAAWTCGRAGLALLVGCRLVGWRHMRTRCCPCPCCIAADRHCWGGWRQRRVVKPPKLVIVAGPIRRSRHRMHVCRSLLLLLLLSRCTAACRILGRVRCCHRLPERLRHEAAVVPYRHLPTCVH